MSSNQAAPNSPMRRALGIPELRGLFADPLTDKRDLFQLAQTSKDFEGPALDRLWRNLPSFIHLLAVLPHDVLHIQDNNRVRFLKFIGSSQWTRFDLYARRVRSLDMDHALDRVKMSKNGAELFYHCHRRRTELALLPNLETLSIPLHDTPDATLLRLLVGPQLRTLTLNWSWTGPDPQSAAQVLQEQCAAIKTLNLHFSKRAGAVNSSTIIEHMPNLTNVLVRGSHGKVFNMVRSLAFAPSLSSLAITGPSDFDFETNGLVEGVTWPDDAFGSLKTIEATYGSLAGLIKASIVSKELQDLTLTMQLPRAGLPDAMTRAFRLIGSSCGQLTSLVLLVRANEDQRDLQTFVLPPKHSSSCPAKVPLEHLLFLGKLQKLVVHDFSNSLIPWWATGGASRAASSWPHLRHLSWDSSVAATPSTFEALGAFATCESLTCLCIPLDATVKVDDEDLPRFKNRVLLGVSDWVITADVWKQVAASIIKLKSDEDGPHGIHWGRELTHDIWYYVEREIQSAERRRRRQLLSSD